MDWLGFTVIYCSLQQLHFVIIIIIIIIIISVKCRRRILALCCRIFGLPSQHNFPPRNFEVLSRRPAQVAVPLLCWRRSMWDPRWSRFWISSHAQTLNFTTDVSQYQSNQHLFSLLFCKLSPEIHTRLSREAFAYWWMAAKKSPTHV